MGFANEDGASACQVARHLEVEARTMTMLTGDTCFQAVESSNLGGTPLIVRRAIQNQNRHLFIAKEALDVGSVDRHSQGASRVQTTGSNVKLVSGAVCR